MAVVLIWSKIGATVRVAWWLALLPHSKKVLGSNPGGEGTFLCRVCMFSPCSRGVSSRCSGFLPYHKNMQVNALVLLLITKARALLWSWFPGATLWQTAHCSNAERNSPMGINKIQEKKWWKLNCLIQHSELETGILTRLARYQQNVRCAITLFNIAMTIWLATIKKIFKVAYSSCLFQIFQL